MCCLLSPAVFAERVYFFFSLRHSSVCWATLFVCAVAFAIRTLELFRLIMFSLGIISLRHSSNIYIFVHRVLVKWGDFFPPERSDNRRPAKGVGCRISREEFDSGTPCQVCDGVFGERGYTPLGRDGEMISPRKWGGWDGGVWDR